MAGGDVRHFALQSRRRLFSSGAPFSGADLRDDQRHAKRRFVREQPVRLFAMVAERFAVIGRDNHQRRTRRRAQIVEQRRQRCVGSRDLAVVRPARILRVERRRRPIRRVRIEEVQPARTTAGAGCCVLGAGAAPSVPVSPLHLALSHPPVPAPSRPRRLFRDPRARERDDGRRRPLGHVEICRRARVAEAIVVDVEALVQAEARVQRKAGDERGGRVARLLEHRRRGARAWRGSR